MATTFWLVLVLSAGTSDASSLLHVGNFSDKEHCQAAGRGMAGPASSVSWVCVQANEVGKAPPP